MDNQALTTQNTLYPGHHNQLRQEEDPNLIIIKVEPIFDNDEPI